MAKQKFQTAQEIAADIAREYREDAARWTQRSWAKDAGGNRVRAEDDSAICWCLRGAIDLRVNPAIASNPIYEAFDRALGFDGLGDDDQIHFVAWNDHPKRTVGEVIALCDKVAQS